MADTSIETLVTKVYVFCYKLSIDISKHDHHVHLAARPSVSGAWRSGAMTCPARHAMRM